MRRVIALDLDETLLRTDKSLSQRTLDLLQAWREQGNEIVVATARPPRSVAGVLPDLLQDVPWVCYNGAEVQQNGRTIFVDLMPAESARHLVDWGLETLPSWRTGVEIDNMLYVNRAFDRPRQYVLASDLSSVIRQPAAKVLFFDPARDYAPVPQAGDDPFAPLRPLLSAMPPATRPMLSQKYRLAQFLSVTADKAVALRFVVEGLGLGMAQVIAFGDDVNDVRMLKEAGLGVAVANAAPEVLAAADRVTASNDEDGVALVLEELLA